MNNDTLKPRNATTVQASHVGQIFFDQSLIDFLDQAFPYTENTAKLTLNEDDGILRKEADTMDPFPKYVWLSDNIYDGIFAWIRIGIDPSQSNDVSAAAMLYESGGVEHEGGSVGGAATGDGNAGGGPLSGSGAAPSGSAAATASSGSAVSTFIPSGAKKGR